MVMSVLVRAENGWSALLKVPKQHNVQVRVRMPREMKRGMTRLAKQRRMAASALYRKAIDEYLQSQRVDESEATNGHGHDALYDHTKSA